MKIFVLGYPGEMGGANTECWHTVKLWRRAGWEVDLVPTWGRDDGWEKRLDRIGCTTHHVAAAELAHVPGLAGAIVVGICNSQYLEAAGRLRVLDCRLVWVNCMCFLFDQERRAWTEHGPADAYIFQSESAREFLGRCHVLLPINGGAMENWPRVGLEAMAAGVPIVAQNEWGWREMIRHGETGFLGSDAAGDNDQELQFYTARLAHDESLRLRFAKAARAHLQKLSDPESLLAAWRRVFEFEYVESSGRQPVEAVI